MDFPEQIEKLKGFLGQLHPLSEHELEDFIAIWQPVNYRRKTLLTTAGTVEKHLYFVTDGVQRAYYLSEQGKEGTIVFTYPFSFSGVADSF